MLALTLTLALAPGLVRADPPAARPAPPAAAPQPVAPPAAPPAVVNVNTADEDELQRVPGIGPSRAQAIVQLRDRVHGFRRLEDLLRVRGIGRATLRAMRPYLSLVGPTTLASRPGRRPPAED
jgi:competence protein ComEA